MARSTSIASIGSEATSTNLERMLQRLKFLLVSPDANTEELLRTSSEERLKVAAVSLTTLAYRCREECANLKL